MTTDCCNHSEKSGVKSPRYRFNPFELGVLSRDVKSSRAFLKSLETILSADYVVGLVDSEKGNPGDEAPTHRSTRFSTRGRIAELSYQLRVDERMVPQPLIDADLVLFQCDDPSPLHIEYIGADSNVQSERALAYIGSGERCSNLPKGAPYFAETDHDAIRRVILQHLQRHAKETPLYGLVLTGGMSTRMQKDKAKLVYHDKPQAQHCFELLSRFCSRVFVSNRQTQAADASAHALPQIHDVFTGFGPIGGILSALKGHPCAAWLVIACDLPLIDDATIADLLAARNPFKLATAYVGSSEFPEPLCAIYEPKSVYRLMAFLAAGIHCPRKVLINSDTKLATLRNPNALDNANSPEEYETMRAVIASMK